ncbi:MAG: hypothetical protein HND57_05055 [Planctomycetes bacterium]|nr:hypothetical protein [Planctomycetota bacterium]
MASGIHAETDAKVSRKRTKRSWSRRLARAGFALLVAVSLCLYIGYRIVTSSWFLTPRFERNGRCPK